jgi:N-methylhydantoinase B
MGAHQWGDGLSAVDVHLGNVAILPAEICEAEYPARIVSTELIPDSGGAGEYRGGLGIRRVYEFLDSATGIAYTEQTCASFASRGVQGGLPGTVASVTLERVNGDTVAITKGSLSISRGDRLVVSTGGGGGFGDPRSRQRSAVAADVRDGKVSARVAKEVYGLARPTDSFAHETTDETINSRISRSHV